MASDKTEEATPKKLRDARKRGEVPRSRELATAAVLLAAAAALHASGDGIVAALRQTFSLSLRAIRGELVASPTAVLEACAALGARAIAPVVLAIMAAAFLASFLQVGALVSFEPISPKLSKLDPIKGVRNLFSQKQLLELLKSLAKIGIVGWVGYAVIRDGLRGIVGLSARDPSSAIAAAGALGGSLILHVGAAMAAVAVLDVLYQRWRFRQDQKMSKDEVKREHKESEGDPHSRQERDRLHREILSQATLEQVRKADVLVVNPTHLAIALKYDQESEQEAPEVLAKGQDDLARRMIDVAREAGVPVLRDLPLAHALWELEEGDEIPETLYEAVAAVLRAAWAEREAEGGAR